MTVSRIILADNCQQTIRLPARSKILRVDRIQGTIYLFYMHEDNDYFNSEFKFLVANDTNFLLANPTDRLEYVGGGITVEDYHTTYSVFRVIPYEGTV